VGIFGGLAIAEHPGCVRLDKIKAHRHENDSVAHAEVWANAVVDGLAGFAAKRAQSSPNFRDKVHWYDSACKVVVIRSCALLLWVHEHADEVEALESTVSISPDEGDRKLPVICGFAVQKREAATWLTMVLGTVVPNANFDLRVVHAVESTRVLPPEPLAGGAPHSHSGRSGFCLQKMWKYAATGTRNL
jgi:hypothetical protein